MRTLLLAFLSVLVTVDAPSFATGEEEGQDDTASIEFFEKNVRPVLVDRCYSCHSATAPKLKGGLRLDSLDDALKGGDTGPSIVPGHPEKSPLIEAVSYKNVDFKMPPKGRLPANQISDLTEWVRRGAPWPKSASGAGPATIAAFNLEQRKAEHWSWRPLHRTDPPAVKDSAAVRRPLDRYLIARLEEKGLEPAPPADPRTLIRRLSFDLVGLPPATADVEAFVADPSDAAYEKLVDRLLASPQYGETWGRHWLDLMRYAETRGHEYDYTLPNAHQYRNYVLRAFNADVPYSQLVLEHLAGDLLPEPRLNATARFNESVIATGWWYLGEWLHSPVDTRIDEMDRVSNQIEVFGKAFLGLTISCARCHDHKFDAISQKDFYALAGFLKSSNYRQVRFDTIEDEKRAGRDLEALRDGSERAAVDAALRQARVGLDSLADYLDAARDAMSVCAGCKEEEGVGKVALIAGARKLDPVRLASWVAHLTKAAADSADPFHPYALVAKGEPMAAILAREQARADRAARALESVEILADFTKPGAAEWTQDGVAWRHLQAGEAVWSADALRGILSTGALRADPLWQRLHPAPKTQEESGHHPWVDAGHLARTATFTLTKSTLYSLVRGAGHAFVEMDAHRQINGPLHGSTVASWKETSLHWVAQNMKPYVSPDPSKPLHRAHVEYSPESADFEVLMLAQGDAAPGNPFDSAPRFVLDGLRDATSPRALADVYAQHAADLSDWLLRHPEMSGPIAPEVSAYAAERAKIAASVRPESRLAPAIMAGPPADEYLLIRGNGATPKEIVPRRFLEAFGGGGGQDRLDLARRMIDPQVTPLVPRVMVNRIWHHLFGRGLVPTVDDFGKMGLPTVQGDLLDHLALRFVEQGGSIKGLIREIVLSSAYRRSSVPSTKAQEIDPGNTLLQHREPRRISAEAVRDAMLAVSGRLDPAPSDGPVPIHLDGFQDGRGRPADGPIDGAGRRSVYLAVHRNFLSSMLLAFDFPQPFSAIGRRSVSNVPAQALILRNNPFVHEEAAVWGKRVAAQEGTPDQRIDGMFRAAYARPATPDEIVLSKGLMQQMADLKKLPADSADVWKELAHALFQAKEFIFIR
jgi:hypothetical protein